MEIIMYIFLLVHVLVYVLSHSVVKWVSSLEEFNTDSIKVLFNNKR
jgi:hypothetical protein